MKFATLFAFILSAASTIRAVPLNTGERIAKREAMSLISRTEAAQGLDTGYNPDVDWSSYAANGKTFAYILATEGIANVNPSFSTHYQVSHNLGFIRGAYHIARLYSSSGADQAVYFLANGGQWSADGTTLPGALWLEFAPSRASCYGFTPAAIIDWIWDFSNAYLAATGRRPVLRIQLSFWTTCVGNPSDFGSTHALWHTYPGTTPGQLAAGWSEYTLWQYESLGISPTGATLPNLDVWNGDLSAVQNFAAGGI